MGNVRTVNNSAASVVMRGSLKEFSLLDVLQCVGVSRQHTVIELQHPDGSVCGMITMKSGHVLNAQHLGCRGRSAFINLMHDVPAVFKVTRISSQPAYPVPIGALTELILEAVEAPKQQEPASRAPAATPSHKAAVRDKTVRGKAAARERMVRPMGSGSPPLAARTPRAVAPVQARASTAKEPRRTSGPKVARGTANQIRTPAAPKKAIAIAIASPKGGVGKTTIALNLALSLSERKLRTTIIDGDINGDLMSLIDSRGRVTCGAYNFLDAPQRVTEAIRATTSPYLKLLPACGPTVPSSGLDHTDHREAWSQIVDTVRGVSDVVLIDCPAGMFHATRPLLESASHVVGVFQSEMVAQRSFGMFVSGISAVAAEYRPILLGVVVNMFNARAASSLGAFSEICVDGERHRLFETTIPRSDAFLHASISGSPLRSASGAKSSNIAWLFDSLAAELCDRLGQKKKPEQVSPFLV